MIPKLRAHAGDGTDLCGIDWDKITYWPRLAGVETRIGFRFLHAMLFVRAHLVPEDFHLRPLMDQFCVFRARRGINGSAGRDRDAVVVLDHRAQGEGPEKVFAAGDAMPDVTDGHVSRHKRRLQIVLPFRRQIETQLLPDHPLVVTARHIMIAVGHVAIMAARLGLNLQKLLQAGLLKLATETIWEYLAFVIELVTASAELRGAQLGRDSNGMCLGCLFGGPRNQYLAVTYMARQAVDSINEP